MKVSELIHFLEYAKSEHGDIEILICGSPVSIGPMDAENDIAISCNENEPAHIIIDAT